MIGPDRPLFNLEITEDSANGISIRLAHAGRRPDILAGIPKDVLRRARPWIWNSYERRVLKKASGMSREAYRIVRDTLLLERARMIMASRPQANGPPRLSWLERRRLDRAYQAKLKEMTPTERATKNIGLRIREHNPDGVAYNHIPKTEPTLSELMRDLTGTALAQPKILPPRDRSR